MKILHFAIASIVLMLSVGTIVAADVPAKYCCDAETPECIACREAQRQQLEALGEEAAAEQDGEENCMQKNCKLECHDPNSKACVECGLRHCPVTLK